METPATKNSTSVTLLLSVAVAAIAMIPLTVAPSVGSVSATAGNSVSGPDRTDTRISSLLVERESVALRRST